MLRNLDAFTIVKTRRMDEMRSVLFGVFDARSFDLHGDQNTFFAQLALFNFGSSSFSYGSYESPVCIAFSDDDYFRFQICLAGNARTSAAGQTAELNSAKLICSPAEAKVEAGPSLKQLALRLDRTQLERDLAVILGARPKERISFDLAADCSVHRTRRLRDKIVYTASSIDITDGPVPLPLLRDMDQSIRIAALYGMPNNYTELLYCAAPAVAPWQVTRIEEWIDANWQADVTIEKLAEVSSASIRSIFASFKKTRGYTPMEYLKSVRLKAARAMLLRAHPDASATAIAFACHFSNPGHFARDYRLQFGELPSETLRQARSFAA